MPFIQLTEDEFEDQFKPVENIDQGKGSYQFDAYDSTDKGFLQFMATNHPNHVWTRIDGDDGCINIINGWHIVDRIDYIVTEVQWLDNHDYEALDYMPVNNHQFM